MKDRKIRRSRERKKRLKTNLQRKICRTKSDENKYRGGSSDATTSTSLIERSLETKIDCFLPSKTAIFVIRKIKHGTDGTDKPSPPLIEIRI